METKAQKLQWVLAAVDRHFAWSDIHLSKLREMAYASEDKPNVSETESVKQGSLYLDNIAEFLERFRSKSEVIDSIADLLPKVAQIENILLDLGYDRSCNSSGFTDAADGGREQCFVSLGQEKNFYKLLHSGYKSDLRRFLATAEQEIDEPMKSILEMVTKRVNEVKNMELALFKAVENNDFTQVKSLLRETGCAIKNGAGLTPLHLAIHEGFTDMVRVILDTKPDLISLKDEGGNTALHAAVEYADINMVQMILQADCNLVDEKNKIGDTALHITAKGPAHVQVAKILLENGACFDLANDDGICPVDVDDTSLEIHTLLCTIKHLFMVASNANTSPRIVFPVEKKVVSENRLAVFKAHDRNGKTVFDIVTEQLSKYKSMARAVVDFL